MSGDTDDVEEPGFHWIVPGDPGEKSFQTRGAALARAWELTPAGGHRAEPMKKKTPVPVKPKSVPPAAVWSPVSGRGDDMVEVRIVFPSDTDIHHDGVFIRREVVAKLNEEASKQGKVLVLDSLKMTSSVESPAFGSAIIINAWCRAKKSPLSPAEAKRLFETLPAVEAAEPVEHDSWMAKTVHARVTTQHEEIVKILEEGGLIPSVEARKMLGF